MNLCSLVDKVENQFFLSISYACSMSLENWCDFLSIESGLGKSSLLSKHLSDRIGFYGKSGDQESTEYKTDDKSIHKNYNKIYDVIIYHVIWHASKINNLNC